MSSSIMCLEIREKIFIYEFSSQLYKIKSVNQTKQFKASFSESEKLELLFMLDFCKFRLILNLNSYTYASKRHREIDSSLRKSSSFSELKCHQ